jgi:hypothetical protein
MAAKTATFACSAHASIPSLESREKSPSAPSAVKNGFLRAIRSKIIQAEYRKENAHFSNHE